LYVVVVRVLLSRSLMMALLCYWFN